MLAFGNFGDCLAIVLLIQKEACLLAVLHIHIIPDPVFNDFRQRLPWFCSLCKRKPALVFLHAFQQADLHIVAFIQAPDFLTLLT
jgi:hypothetical protein